MFVEFCMLVMDRQAKIVLNGRSLEISQIHCPWATCAPRQLCLRVSGLRPTCSTDGSSGWLLISWKKTVNSQRLED
jgi:hypothetical protein